MYRTIKLNTGSPKEYRYVTISFSHMPSSYNYYYFGTQAMLIN